MGYTLQELAESIGGRVVGQEDYQIENVATIQNASAGSITFLANRRYVKYLKDTNAGAVILDENDLDACPVAAIVCDNPYLAYAKIATLLNPVVEAGSGVHATAVIHETAVIHPQANIAANCVVGAGVNIEENVFVGPGCVIEDNVKVGKATRLLANVTLCHDVVIGCDVLMHAGAVVGSDGFGIANDNGEWFKVPQLGTVIIEDNVEIGANTTIDRGALGDTVIETGVKLDNQIQIAHNVRVGAHTAIAGCTGIAGSTTIGKYCAIGGAVVMAGHIDIADKVQVTIGTVVMQSIKKPGLYSSGTPLQANSDWHRNYIRFRQLDDMAKRIRKLEKNN